MDSCFTTVLSCFTFTHQQPCELHLEYDLLLLPGQNPHHPSLSSDYWTNFLIGLPASMLTSTTFPEHRGQSDPLKTLSWIPSLICSKLCRHLPPHSDTKPIPAPVCRSLTHCSNPWSPCWLSTVTGSCSCCWIIPLDSLTLLWVFLKSSA